MKQAMRRGFIRATILWGLLACWPVSAYVTNGIIHGWGIVWLAPQ